LKNGTVKLYSNLDDWRFEEGLEGALASLRSTTIVPDSLTAAWPLSDTVSNVLVVENKYFDVLCHRLNSLPRKLNVAVRLVGVYQVGMQ
jgi:hypothetical protein